jgi:hypothetical protein
MNEEWSKCIEELPGSPVAKERLRVVLEVICGNIEWEEACSRLKVSSDELHEMRDHALQVLSDEVEKAWAETAHALENDLHG